MGFAMRWQEITVTTAAEACEAVANIFYETGAGGLYIEDPRDLRRYIDEARWDAWEISPEYLQREDVIIKGYLPVDNHLPERLGFFREKIEGLQAYFGQYLKAVEFREIDDEDWSECWKRYYRPLKIGRRLVVKPSWEAYSPKPGEIIIELDPGMAFGTGTHPTTALALRALEQVVKEGDVVYDIGTGSGILAIAAALLGASRVEASDVDPLAVKVAQDNVRRNGLEKRVRVREADLLAGLEGSAHVIVANIIADAILRLVPGVITLLRPGGFFIAGGIIASRAAQVEAAVRGAGFKWVESWRQAGWVMMLAQKG
ncbi:MAG: ribosomal protein methyltransferase [Clostridia bacterium]|nr:ribosomal protein methyltransferase [Clostridia bacterium]